MCICLNLLKLNYIPNYICILISQLFSKKKMSLLSNIRIKSGVIINDACNIQLNKFYVSFYKASYRGDSSSHYVIMYIIISRMREINIECNKTCNVYIYTREKRPTIYYRILFRLLRALLPRSL